MNKRAYRRAFPRSHLSVDNWLEERGRAKNPVAAAQQTVRKSVSGWLVAYTEAIPNLGPLTSHAASPPPQTAPRA